MQAGTRVTCSLQSAKTRAQLSTMTLEMQPNRRDSSNSTLTWSFQGHHFLPERDMLEKITFRVLQAIILHRRKGSGNGYSRAITPMQSRAGYGIKLSSKTTTTAGRDWSFKNRSGGIKEKPSKTTPSIQKEHPCQYRHGWLT